MDQSEPGTEPQASGAVVPSVVAVVVTRNPGSWFEEALGSLVDQEYRNLSILVIDAHSDRDPTKRVKAVAPQAFVHRLGGNPGYGRAANHALRLVEGAAFLLLCHDDVALDRSAVQLMVEEAYRSNAGVVGPKVTTWTDPRGLLHVGAGSDQFGVPAAIAERGELDQEQHDGVRDVFAVPGGCVLIRADLFAALGGFDEAMSYHGEDVDLCWRAHLAGARVMVAPSARVRHVEALGERRPDDRRRLQARHRLRMVLSNYGGFYTALILPRQVLLSLLEVVVAVVTGRFRHARDVLGAYSWNLRTARSLWAKRRQVRRTRRVTDLEIRRLQVHGSARINAFVRGQLAGTRSQGAPLAESGRHLVSAVRRGFAQQNAVVIGAAALVVLFGSRHLLTQPIPVLGELAPFPDRASDLVAEWWSGWRSAGLGVEATPPTGLALFGLFGLGALGATGLVRAVLIVGLLPVGMVGAWRLGRVLGRSRAPAAAVVAYAANPLPYSAFAAGSWRGLAAWAASPWILRRLAEATGARPFSPPAGAAADTATQGPARLARQAAGLGLVIALLAVVYPAAPLVVLLMLAGLVVGSALVSRWGGVGRLVLVGVIGMVVAVALHGPWLLGGLDNRDPDLTLAGRAGQLGGYSLADALHFAVGPTATSPLTWGLFVAALLPLAIGRSWRLTWAVRGWTVAAACWVLVALERTDVLGIDLPPAGVLLAPAAAALAFSVALGMAAFEIDLPGYRFGWRQLASLAAAGALTAALLPVLVGSFDGRWEMPRGGYDRALRFGSEEEEAAGPFRVLWLGEPEVLPVAGWTLPDRVGHGAYATTEGLPGAANLWTGPETGTTRLLPEALATAGEGETSRLGQLLAPMGIRYVIVAEQLAPAPFGGARRAADPALEDLLAGQLDLEEVDVNAALRVFRNAAWIPLAVELESQASVDDPAALDPAAVGPPLRADGVNRFTGEVSADTALHLGEAVSSNWQVEVDGDAMPSEPGFGWANRFPSGDGGEVEIRYAVPGRRMALALAQLAVWLVVVVVAVRQPRSRADRGQRAPTSRPAGDAVPMAPVVEGRVFEAPGGVGGGGSDPPPATPTTIGGPRVPERASPPANGPQEPRRAAPGPGPTVPPRAPGR